jgi:hypothetical protein
MTLFLAAKDGAKRGKRSAVENVTLPQLDASEIAGDKGAEAALHALAEYELKLRNQLRKAEEAGDVRAAEVIFQRWLRVTQQLRQFDAQIELERRDSGSLIPREEAEQALLNLAVWMNMAAILLAQDIAGGAIATGSSLIDAKLAVESILRSKITAAIKFSAASKSPIPGWAIKALETGLCLDVNQS